MIGPVQLLVVGFDHPDFRGEALSELQRLREHDVVRVIDVLVVNKDADGAVAIERISDLSEEEARELGDLVKTLVGLGEIAGGDTEGAARLWAQNGGQAGESGTAQAGGLSEDQLIDVLDEIPPDTAVAIALLEHRWAVPLREAIMRAGGFPILDSWIHPRDLVEIGLLAAAEAEALG